MPSRKYLSTKFPGIRYRQHPTRKHGLQFDKYFAVYYRFNGKNYEEGVGWASQGWTLEKVNFELGQLKRNQRKGDGPKTLKEKRELEAARQESIIAENELQKRLSYTFDQFFTESYIPQAKTEKTSWTRDQQIYASHIKDAFGDKPLQQIAPLDIERLKSTMFKKGLAPRTVQYCLAITRRVLNVARNHNVFTGDNPVSKVRMPKVDNRRMRFLSREEAETLLAELFPKSLPLYTMALFSLHTGMRYGEIAALTWGDLDLDNRTILIRNSKNTMQRTAFMTTAMVEAVQMLETGAKKDLVFPSRKGGRKPEPSNLFSRTVESMGLTIRTLTIGDKKSVSTA